MRIDRSQQLVKARLKRAGALFSLLTMFIVSLHIAATGVNAATELIATVDDKTTSGTHSFAYSGGWTDCPGCTDNAPAAYGGSFKFNYGKDTFTTFTFTGTQAKLYGYKGATGGIAEVQVDGNTVGTVDYYAPAKARFTLVDTGMLTEGTHTVKLINTGTTSGKNTSINIDNAEVYTEVVPATTPAKVSAGNSAAVGDWAADTAFVGGVAANPRLTTTFDVSRVTNPAPQAVYQHERYGAFQYNLQVPQPNTDYTVRLHFAEFYFTAIGKRVFAVDHGSTRLLDNFDVFKEAGGKDIAIVREFRLTSDANSKIQLNFVPIVENPKLSGVEYAEAPPADPGYDPVWGTPTWRDEFDGQTVDTDKWTVRNDYLSYDWGDIQASNASINTANQTLELKIDRLPESQWLCASTDWDYSTTPRTCKKWRKWSTAYILSKFKAPYGRWEVRAKLPTIRNQSTGVWPAFWHRAEGGTGEIDTMEAYGTPTTNRTMDPWFAESSYFTAHQDTNCKVDCYKYRKQWNHDRVLNPAATLSNTASTGFHTWTMIKTPTEIAAYFDGQLTGKVTPDLQPWTFTTASMQGKPMDSRLQMQMGDSYYSSNPNADNPAIVTPAVFEVDYIRFWPLQQ